VPEPDDEPATVQEDPDFAEITELDEPADVGSPETEVVTETNDEPETKDDPAVPDENTDVEDTNPDELAALDLPDEPAEDDVVGSHITFKEPKKPSKKK
jgi:hypothetical protein